MAQLWGGRFTKETDQLVYDFNASISFDQRFMEQDIRGSLAHARMLAHQGIITLEEGARIEDAVVMPGVVIKRGAVVRRAIIAEDAVIGAGAVVGEETGNIAVVGYNVQLPAGVSVAAGQQVDETVKFDQ